MTDPAFETLAIDQLAEITGGGLYDVFGPVIDWGTAKVAAPEVTKQLYGDHAKPQAQADIEKALRGAMKRTKQKPKFVPF